MMVRKLIDTLNRFPQDHEVLTAYDGYAKCVELAWITRGGCVMLAQRDDLIFEDDYRPVGAPTDKEDRAWSASDVVDE